MIDLNFQIILLELCTIISVCLVCVVWSEFLRFFFFPEAEIKVFRAQLNSRSDSSSSLHLLILILTYLLHFNFDGLNLSNQGLLSSLSRAYQSLF